MKQEQKRNNVVVPEEGHRRYIDAISQLQENISLANIENPYKVIAITSSKETEGKSTLACNLAHVYALRNKKVLLIDLDLRRSVVHQYFHVEKGEGVVEYCLDKLSKDELVKKTDKGVDVITSGRHTSFPGELLQSSKLLNLIEELKKDYDYIVVDTPPLLQVADAVLMNKFVDGYIVVIQEKYTHLSWVKETRKILLENQANFIGCAIVKMASKGKSSYYYY